MPYSSVDEQVVKMSFDNSNFDKNIDQSIQTLNSLDKQLGILNKNDFSKLTNNVDTLAKTFTVKGQVMLGVLTKLGNKIVNLGNQAFRKLTQGIRDGLGEYNQIIESTQTVFQNVKQDGRSIEDVNNALDELNDYADKTIYNFGQMTRMIGMFTSAGVSLDKSVSSIKGLANAAALVGATMERAQIGWQAVSRAMSSGKFTNVTWRSLELSGIAGKQFNTVIKEVARANKAIGKNGQNIDQMIKKYGSLRESLREGWLTKDLFTEAMDIMSGALSDADLKQKGYTDKQIKELRAIADAAEEAATRVKTFKQLLDTTAEAIGSGWAQSFRILIGDLEEAKKLYTRISDVVSGFIDNNARIRNRLFKQIVDEASYANDDKWKTGRDNFKQIIENMLAVIKTFLKAVKTGFLNVFPIERISQAARKVLEVVEKFTRAFVLNSGKVNKAGETLWNTEDIDEITDSIDNLIRLFRGLASAVDIAWMAISQPIKAIVERIPFFNNFFKNTNEGIVGIVNKLGKFGDKITVFKNAVKNTELFGTILGLVIDNIDELGEEYPVLGAILSVFKNLKNIIIGLKESFESMKIKPFSVLLGTIKLILTIIWKILNGIIGVLKSAKNSIDWSWLDKPKQFLINLLKSLSDYGQGLISFEKVTGKIGEVIDKVFGVIKKLFGKKVNTNNLKTATAQTKTYLSNVSISANKASSAISAVWDKIKGFFNTVGEFFKNLTKNSDLSLDGIIKKIALVGGGVAAASLTITQLVKTLKKVRIIDSINDILLAGLDVVKAYQREMQSKMILNIAISIGILATSLAVLSFIPYERLENGLVIFSSFMAILAMTLPPIINAMAKFNRSLKYTREEIKHIPLTKLDVIKSTLNNLIYELGSFGKEMAKALNKKMLGSMFKDLAISILILVAALSALTILFKLDGDTTITAMKALAKMILIVAGSVAVLLGIIGLFNRISKDTKASVKTFASFFALSGIAAVILSIAASVTILVSALAKMSIINTRGLRKNFDFFREMLITLGVIATVLTAVVGAFTIWSKHNIKGLASIAVIIISIAVSVNLLVNALNKLTKINDKKLRKTFDYLKNLTKTIGLLSIALTAVISLSRVFGDYRSNAVSIVLTLMSALLAIAGTMYLLSKSGPIDESILTMLRTLTIALGIIAALLGIITIVVSRAKTTFSTDFASVINKIALGIGAVIASIGIMTAGIAALIASLSTFDLSDGDANRAANSLVSKLNVIANTIKEALPGLRKVFYSLGKYAGSMFTSFISGFVNNIIETGETYNKAAEKVVNLVIDLISKVVDILHNRKEDIAKIIRKAVDLIGSIITEILNDVFKKNSDTPLKEEDVLRWMGFGTLAIGGGAVLLKIASNFNVLSMSVKNLTGMFAGLKAAAGGGLFEAIGALGFKEGLTYLNSNLINTISKMSLVKASGNGIAKLLTKITGKTKEFSTTTDISLGETAAAFIAVKLAIDSVKAATKGFAQLMGEETRYVRTDVESFGDGLKAFLTDSQFRTQTFIDALTLIGEAIIKIVQTVVACIVSLISKFIESVIWPMYLVLYSTADILDMLGKTEWANNVRKATDKIVETVHKGTQAASIENLNSIWTNWVTVDNKIADGAYKNGEKVGEAVHDGFIKGIDNEDIKDNLDRFTKVNIDTLKDGWKTHSPSKVTEEIYRDVMLGAKLGINNNKEQVNNALKQVNKEQKRITVNGAIDAVKAWDAILERSNIQPIEGHEDEINKVNSIRNVQALRNTNVKTYDYSERKGQDPSAVKEVELNQQLLELYIAQREEFNGKTYDEARALLERNAKEAGIAASWADISNVISASMSTISGATTVTTEGIEKLDKNTRLSLTDVVDQEKAATQMVIEDQYGRYFDMWKLADENKEYLAGKKKEEVEEILKQEAIKKGMTEAEARDTAKLVTAALFTGKKADEKISKDELLNKIKGYDKDFKAFEATEKAKTDLLQKMVATRQLLEKNAKYQELEKARANGTLDEQTFSKAIASDPYLSALTRNLARTRVQYKDILDKQEKDIKNMYAGAGMNANNINKYWEQQMKDARTVLGVQQKGGVKDQIQGLISKFKNYLGINAGGLDLNPWDIKDDKGNGGGGGKGDGDKAIAAAKNLKAGLEAQRADLTPTFDLDKLASDANKANGIVMSSLMAAQNASIGDYINKDSELNPFMKDRWQNVYNFTQNNYSPKALSRIDIYRQTQRQISMSRGF